MTAALGGKHIQRLNCSKAVLGLLDFEYDIRVSGLPANRLPGDGWRYLQRVEAFDYSAGVQCGEWELEYNFYEPGGWSSGHGTNGVFNTRKRGGKKPVYRGQYPWLLS